MKNKIFDMTANPAPLGLMGFGMTTVLLNLHNIGFFPIDSMILGMGFFDTVQKRSPFSVNIGWFISLI